MEMDSQTQQAIMSTDISYIKTEVAKLGMKIDTLNSQFVTKSEFMPVKQLVYGAVGLILLTVIGLLLTSVLNK